MGQALLPGNIKVVEGGFGSGGPWVESGNRLPNNFSPLTLGQCVSSSSTPAQIQAVGYGGDGTTCSFQPYETAMPAVHQNGYYIAASTDVYMGFHFPDNWHNSPRAPEWPSCTYYTNGSSLFNSSNFTFMCAQGCGECYQITGPGGVGTFIVNEVADIDAIGITGQGINLNLGNGAGPAGFGPAPCRGSNGIQDAGECNLEVLSYQGPSAISIKKIPCPVTGNIQLGVHGYDTNPLDGGNSELVLLNHRLGILSVWIQGRDASNNPTGYQWLPRTWINQFLFEPGAGLSGYVYGLSPTKTFDIKIRPVYGDDLVCSNIVWNPTVTPSDSTRGIQSLGTCQFPDPGIDISACDPPFPPNPVIADQFYAYRGSTPNDCPALNKVVSGCSIKVQGNFPIEWEDWGSYGLSPFPNYGFTSDCQEGGCIDSTLSTTYAGIQIGYPQGITPSSFPNVTSFVYWAKCVSSTCNGIRFSIYGGQTQQAQAGCTTVSAPAVDFSSNWTQYTVNMKPLFANCTTYFQTIEWTFGPGIQFYLDTASFYCGSSMCVSVNSTSTGGRNFSPNLSPSFLLFSFLLNFVILLLC